MKTSSLAATHNLVWTALLAAMIAAGSYINVPMGPVPFTLQTFFVTLAGYALGPKKGAMVVALYLLAGTFGLPVFWGGKSGLGHLLGPTGGYLFGFLVSAFISGLARTEDNELPWGRGMIFGLISMVVLFAMGAGWLKFTMSFTWTKAVTVGALPFIPGGVIKIAAALLTTRYLDRHSLLPRGA